MDGINIALIGFIFVCIIFPSLVKNRPQYYAAVGAIIGVILFQTLGSMFSDFARVAFGLSGLLQLGTFLLLIVSTGGLRERELPEDIERTIEVVRRGETEKEILIKKRRPDASQIPMDE